MKKLIGLGVVAGIVAGATILVKTLTGKKEVGGYLESAEVKSKEEENKEEE